MDIATRRIWSGRGANADGHPSLDGRYLTFVDWTGNSGNVGVRDLMTGENRLLTHVAGSVGAHADDPVLAPDNSEVAYIWEDAEIRLVRRDGTHDRLLFKPDGAPTKLVWSPDGRQLAIVLTDTGARRIALVSLTKPAATTLKSTGWNYPQLGGFSPDGKYLVYSLPHTPPAFDGGIFAITADGSRQVTLVQTPNLDRAPMWTPDGRGVVFLSDRSGKSALWHVAVRNGEAQGEPQLLRTGVGELNMGFARDGSYFYGTQNLQTDAYLVGVDPETLVAHSPPARLTDRSIGSNAKPVLSPDGTRVAFVRSGDTSRLVIRSVADGTERILPTLFSIGGVTFGPEWFPDGRTLLVGETDYPNGRAILRRVDVDAGSDSPVMTTAYGGLYGRVQISHDGRSLFYSFRTGGNVLHLMRRDLATGTETDLYHVETGGVGLFGLSLSRDGRQLAFNVNVPPSERLHGEGPRALRTISVDGGTPRELFRGEYSCPAPWAATWTHDGRNILSICDDGQRRRLMAVPVNGGEPRKLDIFMDDIGNVDVSPDGRQIALTGRKREPEVWTVTNLLATLK